MPLLDHFHPPLSEERSWESFHAAWAGSLADDLNRRLPPGYFAEEQTHAGAGVEIDVARWETRGGPGQAGTVIAEPDVWSPPAPSRTVPAVFADDFVVRVFSTRTGPKLVAAIELVSPRNKDRPDARQAFAVKCASYLHQGVSLLVVDVVTERRANLHAETMALLLSAGAPLVPAEESLYAVSHRPLRRNGDATIDLWGAKLAVGQPLPTMPLGITAELCLPIDLEEAYMDARQRRRM
jgi:hypothetical protein